MTTVDLTGEVESSLREQAGRARGAALTAGTPVVLGLGRMDFVDLSGVAFLLQCHRACEQSGQPCTVRDVPDQAWRVLTVLGLHEVLHTHPATGAGAGAGADPSTPVLPPVGEPVPPAA